MVNRINIYRTILFAPFLSFAFLTSSYSQNTSSEKAGIIINIDLEQVYVVIDNDFQNAKLISSGDTILVDAGRRNIKTIWQTINDISVDANLKPGVTEKFTYILSFPSSPRSSYKTLVNQTNLVVTSDPKSTIFLNNKVVGKHFVQILLNPGKYSLKIEHPEFGSIKKSIEVNSKSVTEFARLNKNPSKLPFAAKLLPGAEYIATKRYGRAVITYSVLGTAVFNIIHQNARYDDYNNQYLYWESLYKKATTTNDAITYRYKAQFIENKMQTISTSFNISVLIATGVYLVSTLDALRKPKFGYKGKGLTNGPTIGFKATTIAQNVYPQLSINFGFK